eukprot:c14862_g1_i1.p1 GENE.c14862_g1_i1~~c14862_g1_i1.p1  ORF type:complete len:498 (+),score=54.69 c14862_g1_i1:200-1693(+)
MGDCYYICAYWNRFTNHSPSTVVSVALAGVIATLAALCYAEFSSIHPVSGSSYSYIYMTAGELPAWIVGWSLLLEYTIGTAAIARGWAGYTVHLLENFSEGWRDQFLEYEWPGTPFTLSFVAPLVIALLTVLSVMGVSESATAALVLCVIKVGVLLLISVAGPVYGTASNWHEQDFAPAGLVGIFEGAAILVYAYSGFDVMTTMSGEAKNPERDTPIAVIVSTSISTLLYITTASALTFVSTRETVDTHSPLAAPFAVMGQEWISVLVSVGAFAGITSALIVALLGMARIWYSTSLDGLLPPFLSSIHPTRQTPYGAQLFSGALAGIFATVFDLKTLSSLMAAGTLFAFMLVSSTLLLLKYRFTTQVKISLLLIWVGTVVLGCGLFLGMPIVAGIGGAAILGSTGILVLSSDAHQTGAQFVIPLGPLVPVFSTVASIGGFLTLDEPVWIRFWLWMAVGFVVYALYGYRHSKLQREYNAARGVVDVDSDRQPLISEGQ